MAKWEELFERFRMVQSRRGEVVQKLQEAERARQEFEDWVFAIVPRVMSDIRRHADARAAQFKEQTGGIVSVVGPDPAAPLHRQAPWISYLTLGLANALVHIYATRGGGARLYLQLMPEDASWAQKNHRVVSQAGCFVVRQNGSYELHYLRGDPDGDPQQVMPVDALIYRAFDLLTDLSSSAPL